MKKPVSLLLALVLVVSLLPTTVLADGTPHTHCICAQETADAHTSPYGVHDDTVSWTAWTGDDSLPAANGRYYLTQDVTLSQPWAEEVEVTLCLNGHKIIGADGADAITVVPGAKLSVTDCAGSGQITHAQGASGRGVTIKAKVPNTKSGGSFTLYAGSITGNSAEDGGGVYIEDHFHDGTGFIPAELYLYGGSIANNTASQNGGGVYAKSYFRLHGGSVTGNTAGNLGGGVYLHPDSLQILNVSGTVNVTGNTSTNGAASNLCLDYSQAITNSDALSTSSRIGIHTTEKPDGYRVFPSITFSGGKDRLQCFVLDDPTIGAIKYLESLSPAHCVLWDSNKHFVANGDDQYYTLYEAAAAANDGDTLTILAGYPSNGEDADDTLYYDEEDCREAVMEERNGDVLVGKDLTLDCGDIRVDAVDLEVQEGKTLTLKGASGGLEKSIELTAGHVVVESGDHAGVMFYGDENGVGSGILTVNGGRLEQAGVFAGEASVTGGQIKMLLAMEGSLSLTGGELGALMISPAADQAVEIKGYENVTITGLPGEDDLPVEEDVTPAIVIMGVDYAQLTGIADALEAKVAAKGGVLMSGTDVAQRLVQEVGEAEWVGGYIITYAAPLSIHTTHDWAQGWTTVLAPTATEKGSKERVCAVCGYKETAELPATGGGKKTSSRSNRVVADDTVDTVDTVDTDDTVDWPFTDVKTTDAYYESVKYVYEKQWMKGTSATTFDPEGQLTRAMLATVLYRVAGSPAVTEESEFTDVEADTWYSAAVLWAAQTGVLRGYGNGCFGPQDPVSVEMLNMVLARQNGEDPVWVGDAALARPATRAEIAQALMKGENV